MSPILAASGETGCDVKQGIEKLENCCSTFVEVQTGQQKP